MTIRAVKHNASLWYIQYKNGQSDIVEIGQTGDCKANAELARVVGRVRFGTLPISKAVWVRDCWNRNLAYLHRYPR